jgi:hypothetical protein
MIPTMIATTATMMLIAKAALAPDDRCLAEFLADVGVAVGDVDEGLPPYGQ